MISNGGYSSSETCKSYRSERTYKDYRRSSNMQIEKHIIDNVSCSISKDSGAKASHGEARALGRFEYHAIMKEMLKKYEKKTSPAMACYSSKLDREEKTSPDLMSAVVSGSGLIATSTEKRTHQSRMDYLCDKQSEEYYALIHTAIPDKKVYQISGAKAAVDKEWDKLFKLGTFDLSTVAEKRDIVQRYKRKKEKVHFGTLRSLCHEKHRGLPLHLVEI